MAVVVEQTIPFPTSSLDLQNPHRWNDLYPLIRPTVKQVQTAKGQHILVDQALAKGKDVNIAAIGSLGNFSSKLLDEKNVTAVVTEESGAGVLTIQDIKHALQSVGAAEERGLVIVRAGKSRNVQVHGSDVIEAEVVGELELDHLLHLLGNATESCRKSIHQVTEVVKTFAKGTVTAHSAFQTEKAGGKPAIQGQQGSSISFEGVKSTIEKELQSVLKSQGSQSGQVTYSIHYSDINGLSRLENYIIAKEIADHCHSQNIPFRLSHSTILNHKEAGRGFALSTCAIPSHDLSPQPKPEADTTTSTTKTDPTTSSSLSNPLMKFHDPQIRSRILSGCAALIHSEPTITEYDTIVGDGDCGYTLRDGAKNVQTFIQDKDLSQLPQTLASLVRDLEVNMGGTSGALYCIFLTALAASLASEPSFPEALRAALGQLMKFTRARLGDRTMMDALIPFVETLAETKGDSEAALREAAKGVDGTKKMEAKLGRSTYLDESATRGVPDPGAYGLLVLLRGMAEGE